MGLILLEPSASSSSSSPPLPQSCTAQLALALLLLPLAYCLVKRTREIEQMGRDLGVKGEKGQRVPGKGPRCSARANKCSLTAKPSLQALSLIKINTK